MHYHIIWGSNTAEAPSILNLSDVKEAINKFLDIIKTVEGADKPPAPLEEIAFDDNTRFFRMVTASHKYILVYCSNDCNQKDSETAYRPTLN
jgi:hypothetical protein